MPPWPVRAQNDAAAACDRWRDVANQTRLRVPKLADLMDNGEGDVLAYMGFPVWHPAKPRGTNPLEHLGGEIKGRSEMFELTPSLA